MLAQATHLSGVRKKQFLFIRYLQILPASVVILEVALKLVVWSFSITLTPKSLQGLVLP